MLFYLVVEINLLLLLLLLRFQKRKGVTVGTTLALLALIFSCSSNSFWNTIINVDKTFLKKSGRENSVRAGSELKPVCGNYHADLKPSGVILASAEAKICHVFCPKNMAAKLLKLAEQVLEQLLYSSVVSPLLGFAHAGNKEA